ncbi:MAG: HAD-IC family P-type ATPase, partial [Bacteroidota bacterium]
PLFISQVVIEIFILPLNPYLGNKKWLDTKQIALSNKLLAWIQQPTQENHSFVFFADQYQVLGVFSISDQLREGSQEAIATLQKAGKELHLLSGDTHKNATHMALKVGITQVVAPALPQEKAQFIQALVGKKEGVAMVGDGVNDAEALSRADVGMAMGQGTDIALDVADVALMKSDLRDVGRALRIAQMTKNTIYQNLFWAFAYNIICLPIAAGALYPFFSIILNPMWAGAAMAASSLSVMVNSLKLKFQKFDL